MLRLSVHVARIVRIPDVERVCRWQLSGYDAALPQRCDEAAFLVLLMHELEMAVPPVKCATVCRLPWARRWSQKPYGNPSPVFRWGSCQIARSQRRLARMRRFRFPSGLGRDTWPMRGCLVLELVRASAEHRSSSFGCFGGLGKEGRHGGHGQLGSSSASDMGARRLSGGGRQRGGVELGARGEERGVSKKGRLGHKASRAWSPPSWQAKSEDECLREVSRCALGLRRHHAGAPCGDASASPMRLGPQWPASPLSGLAAPGRPTPRGSVREATPGSELRGRRSRRDPTEPERGSDGAPRAPR